MQQHHLRSPDELDSFFKNRILALQPSLLIDDANVRLECRHEESPPFRVRIHWVAPGPDLAAKSRDHTIHAALNKVMAALEAKLGSRARKRFRRVRNSLQAPGSMRLGRVQAWRMLHPPFGYPLPSDGRKPG